MTSKRPSTCSSKHAPTSPKVRPSVSEPHPCRLTRYAGPASAQMTLAKLQSPVKQSLDKVNDDLKEIHQALGKYGKALDKVLADDVHPLSLRDGPNLNNRNSETSPCQTPGTMRFPPTPRLSTGP